MKNNYIIPAIVMLSLLAAGSMQAAAEPPAEKETNVKLSELELLRDEELLNIASTLSAAEVSHLMQVSRRFNTLLAPVLKNYLINYWSRPVNDYEFVVLKSSKSLIRSLAVVSRDEKLIAAGDIATDLLGDKAICLWDVASGKLINKFSQPRLSAVVMLAFDFKLLSDEVNKLLGAEVHKLVPLTFLISVVKNMHTQQEDICVWDIKSGNPIKELSMPAGTVEKSTTKSITLPTGNTLQIIPRERSVLLREMAGNNVVREKEIAIDTKTKVASAVLSPDGRVLAVAVYGVLSLNTETDVYGSVLLLNTETEKIINTISLTDKKAHNVQFSPSGTLLISRGSGEIRVWRAKK